MERGPVSEGLRKRVIVTVSAGAVIGVVEVVLAISFAVLVFSGFLEDARPSGIGIYLVAASLTLAILAWRAGVRGVVGSVQDAAVPVLAIVASSAALHTFGGVDQAFLTVVAATMIVTLLTALTFLVIGTFRLGNLARFWQPWTYRALTSSGTDWSAVFHEVPGMATAVFVAVIGCLFNVGGAELLLNRDLDSNRELRDVGLLNIVSGLFGGIPGYHALSLTALAKQMDVDGRGAGLVAALVPLATVAFGASIVGLIPRLIVGGVLVFVGLSLLVAWLVDMRRSLPLGE